MAKKKEFNSIWNVIERNDLGETKVLTFESGKTKHHLVVYTSAVGVPTSILVSGEINFPVGEIADLVLNDFG
jgi:hypothetical protein